MVANAAVLYIYPDDCMERPYEVGDAFVDPGGDNVHMAYNRSEDQETVVIATFIGVPEDGGSTSPVDADEGAALDEWCDITR